MILWKFKEILENRPNYPCEKFRWVLQIGWFFAQVNLQYKFKNDNKWYDSHTLVYGFSITKYFDIGYHHIYYDGDHNFYDIGFLHIFWG